MKAPDLKSTFVAALIGAGLLYAFWKYKNLEGSTASILGIGAAFGAGVQIFVRLLGVS